MNSYTITPVLARKSALNVNPASSWYQGSHLITFVKTEMICSPCSPKIPESKKRLLKISPNDITLLQHGLVHFTTRFLCADKKINIDYDGSASAIDGGDSIVTQSVSPPLILFALNPAHAVQGVINFAKSDNVKLHRKVTSRLNDDPFDCVPEDLHQFLKKLADRATEFQWNDDAVGIMQIPDNRIKTTKYTNLLTNHGKLNIEDVLKFEELYINTPTRAAQDTNMLYHCLIGLLYKAGRTKVMVWE